MRGFLLPVVAAIALGLIAGVRTAGAASGLTASASIEALSATGSPFTTAGGHPDRLEIDLALGALGPGEDLKEIEFELPPGLTGDPGAVPVCPRQVLEAAALTGVQCPSDTQVGIATIEFLYEGRVAVAEEPLYEVEPGLGSLAALGSNRYFTSIRSVAARPSDLAVTVAQTGIPREVDVISTRVELWGVPADHQQAPTAARQPFLTLPARCDGGPLAVTARLRTWQQPDLALTATGTTGLTLGGCGSLPFAPRFGLALDEARADSPTGAGLELALPQDRSADGRASAALAGVEIVFPPGVSLSPGAASGLAVCSVASFGRESREPPACPPASAVGTVEIDAAGLAQPLRGSLYLGEPGEGRRFRLFVAAQGGGVTAKLVGALLPDPKTGVLTAVLDHLPVAGLERVLLHFGGGPQALLVTPLGCGNFPAGARLARYDGAAATQLGAPIAVTSGAGGGACPVVAPFAPRVAVLPSRTRAGAYTRLDLDVARQAGERGIDRFTAILPRGYSAALGTLVRCPETAVAAGGCPPASRVGSARAVVGSGTSLVTLAGGVYLTGPYRGAPFGLATVFAARVGPFDLGEVVTKAALRVDPASGQVTAESDPLPGSVEGVALRFRSIRVGLDRPGVLRAPTSCGPRAMRIELFSGATVVRRQQPLAVRGCDRLPFRPRASVRLLGRRQVRPGGRPGLRIGIRVGRGSANLRGVEVRMPPSLRPGSGGKVSICARQAALEGSCPEDSWIGTAIGHTPVVADPLQGPLELVQPDDNGPPEIWADLAADGARFEVRSRAFVDDGRLTMSMQGLPDVPLTALALRLDGGQRGLFVIGAGLCAGVPPAAGVELEAQNGKRRAGSEAIGGARCGGDG